MQTNVLAAFARQLRFPVTQLDCSLSFTTLGGHSLTALRLVADLKKFGLAVTVRELLENRPISDFLSRALEAPTTPLSHGNDNTVDILKNSFIEITIDTAAFKPPTSPPTRSITSEDDSDHVPIPEMQLSLIRGSYASPGTNILAYHQPCKVDELPAIKAAWKQILLTEEIFTKAFRVEDGIGYMVDSDCTSIPWSHVTVSDQSALDMELMSSPSFTDVGFEFRTITIDGQGNGAHLLWHVHHAFIDGFSMSLLAEKVARVVSGRPVQPGPCFTTVIHERKMFMERKEDQAKAYWKSQESALDKAISDVQLPCGDEAKEEDFWNGLVTCAPNVSSAEMTGYAHKHNVTVAAIHYAAWALVLSVVCDSDLVQFGAVMSGRSLPVAGILEVVGSLVNTLPIAISVDGQQDTTVFLREVFEQLMRLSEFDWSEPEHGYSRRFSSVLAMQFDTTNRSTSSSEPLSTPSSRMNSEIPLSVTIEIEGTIHIQYSRKYERQHIELVGTYFARAIESLLQQHHTISMCLEQMLSVTDRKTLFNYGNCLSGLTTKASVHDDLVSLMQRAATQNPTMYAAKIGTSTMIYQDLSRWSSCVSKHLEMYVKPGDIVCVHAEPSLYWLVAVYGILKAGAVYCPLNAKLSSELRASMFECAGASIYLTASANEVKQRPKSSKYCWAVEDLLQRQAESEHYHYFHTPHPETNAYLCFTSGSSGKPKGVLCKHQGLIAFQRDREVRLFAQPGTKVAQIMSVSFDGSIHEVFSALSYGATLVLPTPSDPFAHLHEVDTCILTPSLAATLDPAEYPNLQAVYLVGEQVSQPLNDKWAAKTALYNMYGPTEATCGATIKRLLPGVKVTIGRPNPTTRIYILNRYRHLAPPGVIGQIYLAGVQVSNGYLNQPQLTAERFFPDTVCRGLGEQMYATGDLGYWTENGELVCLGRNDRQVKLRGFRLDLDDIEARLAKLPSITSVAVTRYEDDLVAMVQPKSLSTAECRRSMASILPVHAVPRYVVPVDQFPMTGAGKLDYKAIVRSVEQGYQAGFVPTMTATECQVATIWSDVLGLKASEITADANFIAIGGNSLLQLRLASRLSKAFGCAVPLTAVIKSHTLHDLSTKVDKLKACEIEKVAPVTTQLREDSLSRMELEWSAKYAIGPHTSAFNVSFVCQLGASIDSNKLAQSWDTVMAHHPILRSRYMTSNARCGRYYGERPPEVRYAAECDVSREINKPFNIAEDDPIRVTITSTQMIVTASHIICDLTTMQTLLNSVKEVYQGGALLPPSPSYIAADAWGRTTSATDLSFWTTYLENITFPTTARTGYNGRSHAFILPQVTSHAINAFTKRTQYSQHQLALAAVALALQAQAIPTNNDEKLDLLLGGPFLNRWSEADMQTVGLFLEPIPFRVSFDPKSESTPDANAFLHAVQCSSQMAIAHAVPWQDLLEHLGVECSFPNHPLFEVMVTFHTQEHALRLGIEGVEEMYTWSEGAKFGLMCEFTEFSDGRILLRMEYDNLLWSQEDISRVRIAITLALDMLVRYESFPQMIKTLHSLETVEQEQEDLFMFPLKQT
ncbi:hypothetical protein BJY04DRAFT_213196 [Aspergillus karnatakaensis]|uniref:nonribosomal peptide synthetase gliP n=1 Tax=Aspergillus karnatakaensis TaxID=1810916 RepID=UPI003CCE079D